MDDQNKKWNVKKFIALFMAIAMVMVSGAVITFSSFHATDTDEYASDEGAETATEEVPVEEPVTEDTEVEVEPQPEEETAEGLQEEASGEETAEGPSEAVTNVIAMIDEMDASNEESVSAVSEAYEALSDEEKPQVTNYAHLKESVEAKAWEMQQADTGENPTEPEGETAEEPSQEAVSSETASAPEEETAPETEESPAEVKEDAKKEEDAKVKTAAMPAFSADSSTSSGMGVHVFAGPNVFPENVAMNVSDVSAESIREKVCAAAGCSKDAAIEAVSIHFTDENGEVIQPKGAVSVSITASSEFAGRNEDMALVHIAGDGTASEVSGDVTTSGASFTATSFSVYALVSKASDAKEVEETETGTVVTKDYAIKVGEEITLEPESPVRDASGYAGEWKLSDGADTYIKLDTADYVSTGRVTIKGVKLSGDNRISLSYIPPKQKGEEFVVTNFDIEVEANDVTVTFDTNGGSGSVEPVVLKGGKETSVTMPSYNGTKNGRVFTGWSLNKDPNKANEFSKPDAMVFKPGEKASGIKSDVTYYAAWGNANVDGEFYVRLDGTFPAEPSSYPSNQYTGKILIKGAIKQGTFTHDAKNGVNANLNKAPTDEQIKANVEAKGLKYEIGKDSVRWYVIKSHGTWHVDGVLIKGHQVEISYDGNNSELGGIVGNVPDAKLGEKNDDMTAGKSANGKILTPVLDGYVFKEWNTEPDGSGDSYQNGDTFELEEPVVLYAQWEEPKNIDYTVKWMCDGTEIKKETRTALSNVKTVSVTNDDKKVFTVASGDDVKIYALSKNTTKNKESAPLDLEGKTELILEVSPAAMAGYGLGKVDARWSNGAPAGTVDKTADMGKKSQAWYYEKGFLPGETFTVTDKVPVCDGFVFLGWFAKSRDGADAGVYQAGDTVPVTGTGAFTINALWGGIEGEDTLVTYDGKNHSASFAVKTSQNGNLSERYAAWVAAVLKEGGSVYSATKIKNSDGVDINEPIELVDRTQNPAFTEAGVYEVTRISTIAAGGEAKRISAKATVTIRRKQIWITSSDDTKKYDGTALSNENVSVYAGDDAGHNDGTSEEEILSKLTLGHFASITEPGQTENTFVAVIKDEADRNNYLIHRSFGMLTVIKADMPVTPSEGEESLPEAKENKEGEKDDESFLFAYDLQGGISDIDLKTSVKNGESVTVTDAVPVKGDFTFEGWNTKADGSGDSYDAKAKIAVTKDMTLFAQWSEGALSDATFYILKDASGGIPDKAEGDRSGFFGYTKGITLENAVTAKYHLDRDSAEGIMADGIHLMATPSKDLIKGVCDDADVSFDPNKDRVRWYVIKKDGLGWRVDGLIEKKVGFVYKSADETLPIGEIESVYVAPGEKVTVASPKEPVIVKDGETYVFSHWTQNADGTGTRYEAGDSVEISDMTDIYAQWRHLDKKVLHYEVNGYGGSESAVCDADVLWVSEVGEDVMISTGVKNNVTKEVVAGFNGWNTKADGSGEAVAAGKAYHATESMTLYAQWDASKAKKISVSLEGIGGSFVYDGQKHMVEGFKNTVGTTAIKKIGDDEKESVYAVEVTGSDGKNYTVENVSIKVSGTNAGEKFVTVEKGHAKVLDASKKDVTKFIDINVDAGDFVITKRSVSLLSGSAEKPYDSKDLINHNVIISEQKGNEGFIRGEGVSCDVTGRQREVGTSDNTFTFVPLRGTDLTNYDLSKDTGYLKVTEAESKDTFFTLTVHYQTRDGKTLAPDYVGQIKSGASFFIDTPEVLGYEPEYTNVHSSKDGMPEKDVELVVYYDKRQEAVSDDTTDTTPSDNGGKEKEVSGTDDSDTGDTSGFGTTNSGENTGVSGTDRNDGSEGNTDGSGDGRSGGTGNTPSGEGDIRNAGDTEGVTGSSEGLNDNDKNPADGGSLNKKPSSKTPGGNDTSGTANVNGTGVASVSPVSADRNPSGGVASANKAGNTTPSAIVTVDENGKPMLVASKDADTPLANLSLADKEDFCNILYFFILLVLLAEIGLYVRKDGKHQKLVHELKQKIRNRNVR